MCVMHMLYANCSSAHMCITHIHIHQREKKKKHRGREKKRLTGKKKEKEKNKEKRKNLGLGAREKAKAARHGAEAGERIKAILYASCAFFFQKKKHTAFFLNNHYTYKHTHTHQKNIYCKKKYTPLKLYLRLRRCTREGCGFSSLMKQKIKAKNCAVFCFAGKRK